MSLSHFNKKNKNIEMVDISKKNKTKRYAEARSLIKIDKKLYSIKSMPIYILQKICPKFFTP